MAVVVVAVAVSAAGVSEVVGAALEVAALEVAVLEVAVVDVSVVEVAVVPAPDPERGSVVRAVVVANPDYRSADLAGELKAFCQEHTAPFKYPRIIDFVEELPKTTSGKVRRRALRDQGE